MSDDIFSLIRLHAVAVRPYYARALFAATPMRVEKLGTFAIDRWARVYYDDEIIDPSLRPGKLPDGRQKNTLPEGGSILIHEVEHWLRKHFVRAEVIVKASVLPALTARFINLAQDAEINDDLVEQHLPMWRDVPPVYPRDFGWPDGLLWEEYYGFIRKDLPNIEQRVLKQLQDATRQPPEQWLPSIAADLGKYGQVVVALQCGSGAHGLGQPFEVPFAVGGDDGVGEAESELIRDQVAQDMVDYAKGHPGSVPGRMLRWAQGRLAPPRIAWERELAALVRNAVAAERGCTDYSYSFPNRQGMFAGVIMPALVRPAVAAAVVIDTSASMNEADLLMALGETQGILKACGQRRVGVYCCDTEAYQVQTVARAEDIRLVGGGGTDMGAGIAAARKDGHKVIVVLTDGGTPWPEHQPDGCQIVVGLVGRREDVAASQPWLPEWATHVVKIERKGQANAA